MTGKKIFGLLSQRSVHDPLPEEDNSNKPERIRLFEKALKAHQKAGQTNSLEYARVLRDIAEEYESLENFQAAIEYYNKAIASYYKMKPNYTGEYLRVKRGKIKSLIGIKAIEEASLISDEMFEECRSYYGEKHVMYAYNLYVIARELWRQDYNKYAVPILYKAKNIYEEYGELNDDEKDEYAKCLLCLGKCYGENKDLDKAKIYLKIGIDFTEIHLEEGSKIYADLLSTYARYIK